MGKRGIANNNLYNILSEYDLDRIHSSALEVLEKTGLRFNNQEALNVLDKHGCMVNRDTKMVRFPRYIVEDAIEKCPDSFTVKGRTPEYDALISSQTTLYGNGTGFQIVDRESGERRNVVTQDAIDLTTFIDNLDNLGISFCSVGFLTDKPMLLNWEYMVREVLKYGKKPFLAGGTFGAWDPKWLIEMTKSAGREILGWGTAASPLDFSENVLRAMMLYAKEGWPVGVYCGISVGATGPTTLAGGLVQQYAEILSGTVLVQAINPGNPVLHGTFMLPMDMRSGHVASAAVETTMIYNATAQLARRYKIPCWIFAPMTDSKLHDQQAGYEKGMQWIACSMAGVNVISGAGQLENEELTSYYQFVIDNEMIEMAKRFMRGIDVTDETLAVDLINDVGPVPGHFLNRPFTKQWWKKEHFVPKISNREPHNVWEESGSKELLTKAKEEADAIFDNMKYDPLPEDVVKEMDKVIKKAEEHESK